MLNQAAFAFALTAVAASAQKLPPPPPVPVGVPSQPLGAGPWVFDTAEQHKVKLTVVVRGLAHPWSFAFLPDGNILVTERSGKLRIIKDGVLSPTPIPGMPAVHAVRLSGLMDLALHPQFATNHLIYFTYTKDVDKAKGLVSTTLARGKYENGAVTGVEDLHISDSWDGAGGSASRIVFSPDGYIFMTTGASNGNHAQELTSTLGKILRLRDDGKAAPGNPFAGRADAKPEIWSMGHRNSLGLMIHPSGVLWNNENGPNGGDEINIIQPGKNYGWPIVSFGRDYSGAHISSWKEGFEEPIVSWNPAIAVSGMATYTGDKIPVWKGNVFVGAMRVGEIPGTGHLERIVFNEKFEELRRESMFSELHQRVRDVRQGPDGYLYILTDEDDGALMRIEAAAK